MDNARYSQDNRTTDTQPGKAVSDAALMLPAWPEVDGPSGAVINLDDLATIVWATLTPARLITGETLDRPANKLIVWRKPSKYVAECGLRAYVRGRFGRKRRIGELVFTANRYDCQVSSWKRFHEGVVLFDTTDQDGSFMEKLQAAAQVFIEATARIDRMIRANDGGAEWPREWRGMHTVEILKEAFQKRGSRT